IDGLMYSKGKRQTVQGQPALILPHKIPIEISSTVEVVPQVGSEMKIIPVLMEMNHSKPSGSFSLTLCFRFFLTDQCFDFLTLFFRDERRIGFFKTFSQYTFDGTPLTSQDLVQSSEPMLVKIYGNIDIIHWSCLQSSIQFFCSSAN